MCKVFRFGFVLFAIPLLGLLYSCSASDDAAEFEFNAPLLEIQQQVVISETDDLIFGRIFRVSPDAGGRIFVPDSGESTIFVFDDEGNFLKNIGREGRGPGEFDRANVRFTESNELFAYDDGQRRVQIFRETSPMNWELHETFNVGIAGERAFPFDLTPVDDELVLANYGIGISIDDSEENPFIGLLNRNNSNEPKRVVELMNPDMAITRTSNSVTSWWHPFGGRSMTDFLNRSIYFAHSNDFTVYRTTILDDATPVLDTLFSHNVSRVPLTDAVLNKAIESYRDEGKRAIRDVGVTHKPHFQAFHVDDKKQIWVQIYADKGEPDWFVFSETGALLFSVDLPDDYTLSVIRNNNIYGIKRDEYDVPHIVVFHITDAHY